jgi:hypothetical protein
MKSPIFNAVVVLATLNILSACTHSDSGSNVASTATPQSKTESTSPDLSGTYEGISAVCEDGTEAKKDNESIQRTTLTFSPDGAFKSEVQIKDKSVLETKGSYTVKDDRLTFAFESQTYESNMGLLNDKTEVGFKLEDKELTLTLIPTEENPCPPDKALIIKYHRQESPNQTTPGISPTPTPAA